ncbi:MAG: flagellar basal body P-ring formation chaperone FlgA [Desulforhopalus sp.]
MIRILLILFSLLVQGHVALALEITFNKSCAIDGSVITLGDIAGFDENSDVARTLAALPLGQAPPPGKDLVLRSITVQQFLLVRQPDLRTASWKGSPAVTVHRRGVTIGPERVQSIIDNFIADNLNNLPEADISFVPDEPPLPFTLPTGSLTLQVVPSSPGIIGSSRFSIIFKVDDEVVKNLSVRGETRALAEVVVGAKPLRRGQLLTPNDLTTAIVDISEEKSSDLELDDFIGKELTRSLRAGKPVLDSMVEAPPVVHRGERVKIVLRSGTMLLTATGLAQNDGSKDEMIRVQNTRSNKIVYCRVAAPGLVEVML